MEMRELVSRCRSYRRFNAAIPITEGDLRELVSLARCVPSAGNRQPLKYVLSCTPAGNQRVFETLAWAGYLTEWPGPGPEERPTGYIVVCVDTTIAQNADVDVGIAVQTILLAAVAGGRGGCMFGAIKREELTERLGLPAHLSIALVVALGTPVEHVVLEDLPADRSIRYYRTADATHHVPKRGLDELIHSVYSGR
jgi:nitroreductase